MPTISVNTDILIDKPVADYVTNADHRIRAGFRAALETLGIPLPAYAARQPSGPKPGQRLRAAFNGEEPAPHFLSIPANASTLRLTNEPAMRGA